MLRNNFGHAWWINVWGFFYCQNVGCGRLSYPLKPRELLRSNLLDPDKVYFFSLNYVHWLLGAS